MFCLDISKTYSALEATILVGSLQFKNAAGTGVGDLTAVRILLILLRII